MVILGGGRLGRAIEAAEVSELRAVLLKPDRVLAARRQGRPERRDPHDRVILLERRRAAGDLALGLRGPERHRLEVRAASRAWCATQQHPRVAVSATISTRAEARLLGSGERAHALATM